MTKKQTLANHYLQLRKIFDGSNFIGVYPSVEKLCSGFRVIDLEDKIQAVKNVIIDKYESYIKNNDSMIITFKTKRGNDILVTKYQFLPYFEIKYYSNSKNIVYDTYNHLSPFDCLNMIEELLEN